MKFLDTFVFLSDCHPSFTLWGVRTHFHKILQFYTSHCYIRPPFERTQPSQRTLQIRQRIARVAHGQHTGTTPVGEITEKHESWCVSSVRERTLVDLPESGRKAGVGRNGERRRGRRSGWTRKRENKGERKSVCSVAGSVLDLLAVCWTNDCAATAMEKLGWKRLDSTIPTVSLSFSRFPPPRDRPRGCRTKKVYGLQSAAGARAARGRRREYNRLSNLETQPLFSFDRPLFHSIHARVCTCMYVLRDRAVCLVVVPVENSQSLPFDRESAWLLAFSTTSWLPCRV